MEGVINGYYLENAKKLRQMVDKVLFKLGFGNLVDKEDFYSLANEIFTRVLMSYDNEQDFDGFLYSCLMNKFKTEMTRRNRYKRTADKNSISIDTPIGDEDNSRLSDIIADNKTVESEVFQEDDKEEWREEIKLYLDTLSPLQRKIAFLLADNNTPKEICEELDITMKHFENSVKRILSDERIKILRPLVERN